MRVLPPNIRLHNLCTAIVMMPILRFQKFKVAEKQVLIAYGTRYGQAGIVADDIGAFLENKGFSVDIVNLRKEKFSGNLKNYNLVIAGFSVAMFSWIGKVKQFLRKCRKTGISPVVYICCGTAIESPDKAQTRFLDKVIQKIGLNPIFSQPIAPVIDFRPGLGLPENKKKHITGTIRGTAKDNFLESGLMDFRIEDRFNNFLEKILDILQPVK